MIRTLTFALLVAFGACNVGDASAAEATVRLREESLISGPLIHIGDVAEVTADNAFLAQRIRELDLARVPSESSGDPIVIPRRLVEARVALSDHASARVVVQGPEAAHVRVPSPEDLDRQFQSALRRALAEQLRADEKDVRVELVESVDLRALLARGLGTLQLEPRLPTTARLGRQRIPVELREADKLVRTVNVSVDVTWHTSVVVATRELNTGHVLTAQDVETDTRWIDKLDQHSQGTQVVGQALQRAFRAGDVIRVADVRRVASETEYLVHPRDVVRIVAQRGPLRVIVMDGEVLQRGRQGDIIRVRNPSTKTTLTARVVDRTQVVVTF